MTDHGARIGVRFLVSAVAAFVILWYLFSPRPISIGEAVLVLAGFGVAAGCCVAPGRE